MSVVGRVYAGIAHSSLRRSFSCCCTCRSRKSTEPTVDEFKDPLRIIREEWRSKKPGETYEGLPVPRETDIAIIGGGVIGSAIAYWLKRRAPKGFNVHVIERDDTYKKASTVMSVGGIRQQFSIKENVEMSLFGAEFLRNIKENLAIEGHDPPDVQFNPSGYLILASEDSAAQLEQQVDMQLSLGAKVIIMGPKELKNKFPWLNTEGVALGSYGIENEGYFDPWLLLQALRQKAQAMGANYVKGEVVGFLDSDRTLRAHDSTVYKRKVLDDIEVKASVNDKVYPMRFSTCIVCAGAWSGDIAKMAGIGVGDGILSVPLPVEPRKRYVYAVQNFDGPGLEMPVIADESGLFAHREGMGGLYLCGQTFPENEPDWSNLDVDYSYFDNHVWPSLAHRIPAFESLKLRSAWAGYYDYNYFDENLILGSHPYHRNLVFATGCSGHGLQQSFAIGRAIGELVMDSEYTTINLDNFSFDRIVDNMPYRESSIF